MKPKTFGMNLREIRNRMKNGEKFYHGVSNPDNGKNGKLITMQEINRMIKEDCNLGK